jgi:O-antigen/teichoic acid export membrane protein
VALGIALYLPRHLGVADYGRYAFVVGHLALFQVLPDASLEAVAVARLARGGADAALAGRTALVRLLVSLAGGTLGLAVLAAVTRDRGLVAAAAMGALGLAAHAASPYRVLLRARLDMARYAGLLAAQAALGVGLLAVVVEEGGDVVAVFAATSAAALAALVLGRLITGPGARLAPDRSLARGLTAAAWPLAGTTAALAAGHQVVQLLLLRLHGAAEVGFLGGAHKLVEAVGLVPQALMLSVLPALALAAAPGEAPAAARDAARALMVGMVPLAAALALWAEPLLVALFGPSFAPAAPVLRVLAAATLIGATGSILSALLVALGLQRALLRVSVGAAVAMVGIGAVLVPARGAAGAALASVLVLLGGQLALLAIRETRLQVGPVLRGVLRPLGLGAVASALVASVAPTPAAGLPLLVLAYAVLLLATRTVTRADLRRWRS